MMFAQAPQADFTANIQEGCAPIVVNFTDRSTGNPVSWKWDFGNGATSTKQNPSATFFDPGKHTVTLTVINDQDSSTVVKQDFIIVYALPTANFIADKKYGCYPTNIQFLDSSTQAEGTVNNTWFWDFGDGTQSTEQNPVHSYTASDKFTVTMKVTSDKGCTKIVSKPNYIEIVPGVTADFLQSNTTSCHAPAVLSFTNKSTGPGTLTYKWLFSDDNSSSGSTNANHTYTTDGSYPVSLAVTSSIGCADTLVKNINIGFYKTDFVIPTICEQKRAIFIDSSSPRPLKRLWVFPDGTTDTSRRTFATFSTGGSYDVKLITDFGACKDSVTKTVTATSKPPINFTGSDTVACRPPATVNFTNNTNGVSYQWNFGDSATSTEANPSHTYTTYGNFPVTVIATNAQGCVDTLTKPSYIKIQQPSVSFENLPKAGCIPYTITPRAAISSVDSVVSYLWDFGDGSTSTEARPTHTYPNLGSYTVSLTVTTRTGCTASVTLEKAVRTGTKPTAAFTVNQTDVCAMQVLQFTDQSTPKDSVNKWFWSFGDGGTSSAQNPAYQFADTGYMDVKLVAYHNGCKSDTMSKPKLIHIKGPIASFDYQPNCDKRTEYTFTDKSLAAHTWEWDFGDGSPKVRAQNPGIHTFPPGFRSYNVSLTVTNPNGCSFTVTRKISIIDKTPDITTPSAAGCKPFQPQLIPQSPDMGSISQFVWDYGNGTTGTGNPGTPTYTNSGYYTVTLTTVDSFGCKNAKTKPQLIRVNGPVARIASSNPLGCRGATITFNDSTRTDGINPIVSWQWDFGDSTSQTYTQPPFQHTYDTLGNLDISLTVKDAAGCTDRTTLPGFVRLSTLKAVWDASRQTCPGSPLSFNNATSSDYPMTSSWYFGNGDSTTGYSVNYAYKDTGYFTAKLIVRDAVGCVDSLIREKYIYVGKPKADFTANNFTSYCAPFQANFSNASSYYTTWLWDLGTGSSKQMNPTNYYVNTGTYDVKLSVISPGGCKDSVTKQVRVFNPQDAKFTYSPISGCRPVLTNFEAFSEMNGRFVWDFRDGVVVDTNINKVQHLYDDPGNYFPRVILTEPSGSCIIPLTGRDPIRVYGAKTRFGLDKNLFCDSGYVTISDSTRFNDPSVFTWQFGDGTTSNNTGHFSHFYDKPGNYSVLLTVRTQNGCIDSLRKGPIKVVQSPLISISGDSIICVNDRLRQAGVFDRSDTSAVQWVWSFPNGNQAFIQYPASQQYTQAGNFMVLALAVNSSGCADTAYKNLIVNPLPTVTLPATLTKQAGYPITIPATYTQNVISYTWTPSETLSCPDCPQPVSTTKFRTKYKVSFIDSNGCRNTGEILIIVTCPNANVFVPNTFSPNGDGSNDVFYVRGRGLERVKSLRIFNRWGEVVFEKRDFAVNDASGGWNGRYKNNPPQPDVYVYQLEVYCENGDVIRFDGNVALIQ